jgi:hypothetical protein
MFVTYWLVLVLVTEMDGRIKPVLFLLQARSLSTSICPTILLVESSEHIFYREQQSTSLRNQDRAFATIVAREKINHRHRFLRVPWLR